MDYNDTFKVVLQKKQSAQMADEEDSDDYEMIKEASEED